MSSTTREIISKAPPSSTRIREPESAFFMKSGKLIGGKDGSVRGGR
jgi:hypothetical protein